MWGKYVWEHSDSDVTVYAYEYKADFATDCLRRFP